MEAGLERIRKYIMRRQNMVVQYIATRLILDLCERSARRPRARVSHQWWEQAGLDLEGEKKRAAVTAADLYGEDSIGEEEGRPLE